MYVTRPLSVYIKSPSSLSLPPPEGPNSGILVIQDEEAEPTCCFGLCKSYHLRELPFSQNERLTVSFDDNYNRVVLIPVLNQLLSSNQYYAIQPRGMHKGHASIFSSNSPIKKAIASSKEEDKTTCCLCNCISDRNPQPCDPKNIFQQFEICRRDISGFFAKSVAPDGEATGLDANLRFRLPDFNFPLSNKTSKPVVVGKWENVVVVDVVVQTEVVSFARTETVPEKKNVV
ncbi:hypothetical protein Pint_23393 [Pistacia integerrima]|uniref:Uncharacterized protein n=1 Tax=Pistacia integerrima TaxID=434235 RepID=A0ACC0YMK5_9ROSI|nr:hypothetical protein Pint_23393 [Pistacia integerrima]